ncbi:MAG: glycosyltransferase family 4 protein [Deltaproteobacteria bacterium]|nr:glycosyltransferase family 4 protein [Deltaproteobacteria bacterium]
MTGDSVGGVWTYCLELSKALGEFGIEVVLAAMGALLTDSQKKEAKQVSNLTVYESPFKLEWMEEPWEDVEKAGESLLKLEEIVCPDIIHLNGYAHAKLPWKAPALVVAHSCVISWWDAVKRTPAPSRWNRYRQEVTLGLNSAELIIAPTKTMLDSIYRNYETETEGIVIANGRKPENFKIGKKENFIFTAGRLWDEAKNIGALHRIAPSLSWPVYAAGNETLGKENISLNHIRSLGRLSSKEMAEWLSRASIYCLPAFYEPFGLSALEAGLSGCALVLGNIPSLREIWDDAAIFIEPDDIRGLKKAIESLIESPEMRREYSEKAYSRALSYSPARMAQGYLEAYKKLFPNKLNVNTEVLNCAS